MNILLISIPSWPHHIWYQEPSFSFFSKINIENFTFLQICNPFKYSTKSSLNKQSTLSNRVRQDNIVQCGLYFYMNSFWGQLRKHLYELFNANASIQTLHLNFLFFASNVNPKFPPTKLYNRDPVFILWDENERQEKLASSSERSKVWNRRPDSFSGSLLFPKLVTESSKKRVARE